MTALLELPQSQTEKPKDARFCERWFNYKKQLYRELGEAPLKVFLILESVSSNQTNYSVKMTVAELMEYTGLARGSVVKGIADLEERNIIRVNRSENGGRIKNQYFLVMDNSLNSEPLTNNGLNFVPKHDKERSKFCTMNGLNSEPKTANNGLNFVLPINSNINNNINNNMIPYTETETKPPNKLKTKIPKIGKSVKPKTAMPKTVKPEQQQEKPLPYQEHGAVVVWNEMLGHKTPTGKLANRGQIMQIIRYFGQDEPSEISLEAWRLVLQIWLDKGSSASYVLGQLDRHSKELKALEASEKIKQGGNYGNRAGYGQQPGTTATSGHIPTTTQPDQPKSGVNQQQPARASGGTDLAGNAAFKFKLPNAPDSATRIYNSNGTSMAVAASANYQPTTSSSQQPAVSSNPAVRWRLPNSVAPNV
jgi:hypothetical protein